MTASTIECTGAGYATGRRIDIASAKVSRRKNEHGEWVVRARDCRGDVLATYYTDDKADAIASAAAMLPTEVRVGELGSETMVGAVFRIDDDGRRVFRFRVEPKAGDGKPDVYDLTPEQAVHALRAFGYSEDGIRRVTAEAGARPAPVKACRGSAAKPAADHRGDLAVCPSCNTFQPVAESGRIALHTPRETDALAYDC